MKTVIIYSDGACEGNPGPGGWAAVLKYGTSTKEIAGGEPATTNNRMELLAAIEALRALKEPCAVEFHTDSEYVKTGIEKWLRLWKARGWRTVDRKPVKNEDLWRGLDQAASRHRVNWHWVKGHAGDPMNERCDVLAKQEIGKLRRTYTRAQLAAKLTEFRNASGSDPIPQAALPGLASAPTPASQR